MTEIEFSVMNTECLDRRIPDASTLRKEVTAWYENRDNTDSSIDWQFITDNARP